MEQKCSNCSTLFIGKYCNQCGQKASVGELTMHDVLHESWHAVTHTDNGILRLVKDLFLHPKSVYLNYFAGQRKKYFSPVTFFIITVGILLYLGLKIYDYEDYKFKINNEFGRFSLLETKFKTLLLLPFEIFITWILFQKRYNLAKNIVFWLYLNGFLFAIKIILTPLYFPLIAQKSFLDQTIQIIQYIILLIHLILIFGNKKWTTIVLLILIATLILISDYILTGYLLFENEFFKRIWTKTV